MFTTHTANSEDLFQILRFKNCHISLNDEHTMQFITKETITWPYHVLNYGHATSFYIMQISLTVGVNENMRSLLAQVV